MKRETFLRDRMRQDCFRLSFYFNWDRTGVFLVEVGWDLLTLINRYKF